jgi:predicted acyl esterase
MATILIDKNVLVPMRDGVQLATDFYRLDGAMPAPALITRTPYDKEQALAGNSFDIMRAVQAGYAAVVPDVRGRYASEGAEESHIPHRPSLAPAPSAPAPRGSARAPANSAWGWLLLCNLVP